MNDDHNNGTLVVGPAWVGDMIMAQSLFKLLRAKHPDRDIDVLAPAASLPLVQRMPEVSMGILLSQGHGQLGLAYRKRLGETLGGKGYHRAVILPNSLKSALVPFFADVPVRTGFRGEYRYALINDMRMLNKTRLPRMVDRFVALGVGPDDPLPRAEHPKLIVDADNLAVLTDKLALDLSRPVMGICPGAEYGDAKRWPERHFAALCDYAVTRGMNVWILGGPKDRTIAGNIMGLLSTQAAQHTVDLTGETSLIDVIDLLGTCALVVSNDSGLMHIASAVEVPVVVLYGSTSPDFTPPLTDRTEILSLYLSCSPCFKRICPLGHKNCLNQLFPSMVEPIVDRYADGSSP